MKHNFFGKISIKLLSLLLVLIMAFGLMSGCVTYVYKYKQADDGEEQQEEQSKDLLPGLQSDAVLSFVAMSDTHMGDQNTENSLEKMLSFIDKLDVTPDLYVFNGDLTNTTGQTLDPKEINTFKSIYEKHATGDKFWYTLGPTHDVPASGDGTSYKQLFVDTFGAGYYKDQIQGDTLLIEGIRHRKVNGFDFISIDWCGSDSGSTLPDSVQNYLRSALAASNAEDPTRPIFVSIHAPGVQTAINILKDYPQVVCFTAHIHNSITREDSISQDSGYTSIHLGGMNYYRVDGYNRFTSNPYLGLGDIYDFAQGVLVQVDSNNMVSIIRMDGMRETKIGETWVVGPDHFSDYLASRKNKNEKCYFEDDDKLLVKEGSNYIKVTFDPCKAGENGAPRYYQVNIYTRAKNGAYTISNHLEIASLDVFYPNYDDVPAGSFMLTFTGLDEIPDDYAIEVVAYDCWTKSSNALVYSNGEFRGKLPWAGTAELVG